MRTFLSGIRGVGLAVIAIVGVVVLAGVLTLGWLTFFAKPIANAQYQVTTHTQPYIQTHQSMLLSYYADWQSGDIAHKAAAVTLVCSEAALLEPSEYPAQVAGFIATQCH